MSNQNKAYDYIEGYQHISSVVETTVDKMNKIRSGELKPILTSLKKESEYIGGLYPSDQVVVAARTGVGKTAKVLHDLLDYVNPAINPYYTNKILVLYDSWEMVAWRNILRFISREGGIPVKSLLDYQQRLEQERFNALTLIAQKFKGLPIYISSMPSSVAAWKERKMQIQGKYPDKYIINIFDHTRLALKSTEAKEEEMLHNLMVAGIYLKNNFNMINIFLSQMNRNIETALSRDKLGTHLPVASDIFGSDSVFQCADVVLALHRPGMYGLEKFEGIPTGISLSDPDVPDNLLLECVLKQRDGWTGNFTLKHNLAINKIEDFENPPKKQSLKLMEPDF